MSRAFIAVLIVLSGCAAQEAATDDAPRTRRDQGLVHADSTVRTIQLYRGEDEASLPIVRMDGGAPLSLSFDVMGSESNGSSGARPLSVYFYHADREWRRDLVPAEYLDSFHRDDLLDYQTSRGTQVAYVHYEYRFPNESIRFRMSGNYIIRVTEQGMEDDVLFERRFFVSEQSTLIDFALDNVLVPGAPYSALQPHVSFTPPGSVPGNPFDYTVCFQKNGGMDARRCTDRPSLAGQPALRYYLEPETSFLPEPTEFHLDVSDIQIGGRVERVDRVNSPWTLQIEPDYYRFPGTPGAPLQNGQTVIHDAVRNVPDPGTAGEYVNVALSLVPDNDTPVPGSVFLLGDFNAFQPDEAFRMRWNGARYESTVLLKQGRYEYRYAYTDPETSRGARGASPRFENVITTFVYYRDLQRGSDRLLSALSVVAR